MQRYIAFLRGMNLGNRRLPMSRLKSLFEELKFRDVATFIASGNVLFSSDVADTASLESKIAQHLGKSLGYPVDTFIRTAAEVSTISRSTPFPGEDENQVTIHVGFFHARLPATTAAGLAALHTDVDEFRVIGREYYWLCRIRISESKVWTLPEAKALRLPTTTMRNMKSLRKLVAKHLNAPDEKC